MRPIGNDWNIGKYDGIYYKILIYDYNFISSSCLSKKWNSVRW